MSTPAELADDLAATFLFEHLSAEQLAWLVARGFEERYAAGSVLFTERQPATSLWILLDGGISLTKLVGGREETLTVTEQRGVYAGAVRAFVASYGERTYGSNARLTRDSRLFRIPAEVFTQLLANEFPMALHLLDGLFLGVRNMETVVRQREKLVALGGLSAGLAHELNNPAAAGRRASGALRETAGQLRAGLAALAGAGCTPQTLAAVADFAAEAAAEAEAARRDPLDPLARSDREEELGAWLADAGVPDPWALAPELLDAGLGLAFAQRVRTAVGERATLPALRWIAASAALTSLLDTLDDAVTRISALVDAVRDYTYMDQATQQEIDVHDGLESTLAVLGHRLNGGVRVERHYDRSLPPITAYGSELNQVWTNLLDNALDAIGEGGTIRVTTGRDGERLLVEVADDGPGIPADVQPRILEPFFTTKDVGAGTGLGLDMAYRVVVDRHGGDLRFTSRPGDTRFQVRLPVT